jgi:hypothetical protein
MSNFSKATEKYIQHEVKLRLHDYKFLSFERSLQAMNQRFERSLQAMDQRFERSLQTMDQKIDSNFKYLDQKIDDGFKHVGSQLRWMLGIIISTMASFVVPVVLRFMNII